MESCEDSTRAGAEADMSGDGQTVLDRLARPDAEASAKSVLDDLFWVRLPWRDYATAGMTPSA